MVFTVTAVNLNDVRSGRTRSWSPLPTPGPQRRHPRRGRGQRQRIARPGTAGTGLCLLCSAAMGCAERITRETASETTPDESRAEVLALSALIFWDATHDLYTVRR